MVNGGVGSDRLVAHLHEDGFDDMTGGTSGDSFTFDWYAAPLGDGSKLAVIHDFSQSDGDKIDLSGLNIKVGGVFADEAFDWIGTAAFRGTAGELRYQQVANTWTMIYGDQDGDASFDVFIQLNGLHTLTADDFVL